MGKCAGQDGDAMTPRQRERLRDYLNRVDEYAENSYAIRALLAAHDALQAQLAEARAEVVSGKALLDAAFKELAECEQQRLAAERERNEARAEVERLRAVLAVAEDLRANYFEHRDRDWRNNALSNLEALCSACHGRAHRSLPDSRTRQVCGNQFTPRRSTSVACSRRCAGVRAARLRLGRAT